MTNFQISDYDRFEHLIEVENLKTGTRRWLKASNRNIVTYGGHGTKEELYKRLQSLRELGLFPGQKDR